MIPDLRGSSTFSDIPEHLHPHKTHILTHIYTHMRTLIHIHAHSYTCMHTLILIHIHTLRYIHLPSYTLTRVHMHVHTVMYRHTYANIINFKMKMVKNNPCRMTESINEHAHTEHTHAQHACIALMQNTQSTHA